MPERWERELDKLSFVDAPASTRARVTAGPRGDEMPPSPRGGQRVAAGVVAFVVFGAAAALAAGALRSPATTPEGSPDATANAVQSTPPSGGPILTATLEAPRDGSMPELVLTYGGRTDSFLATDGEWPGVQGFPLPIQIFEGSLDPGATISVESDAQSIEARLLVADQNQRMTGDPIPIDLSSGTATLPNDAGSFRLNLIGTWARGSAGFSVGITIGTPTGAAPPPSVIKGVVPDVIGLDERDAIVALKEAGFVGVGVFAPANAPAGVVISSDPPAGAIADVRTTVTLTVSNGP
ncbi:MAG: PASTA domain-containing protein [Actinobacteria bacterium]|nr:MAG: PASTA domain-containing protein [Actinomycetota bacterium]